MIKEVRQQLEEIKKKIGETDFQALESKADWREYSATINPIIISGKLGMTINKVQLTIDTEGNAEDKDSFNFIKDVYNQALMMSDLSDSTTKAKIFDSSGLIAGKGEVRGNVNIVQYSASDVIEMMKEEDEKYGETWAKDLKEQK